MGNACGSEADICSANICSSSFCLASVVLGQDRHSVALLAESTSAAVAAVQSLNQLHAPEVTLQVHSTKKKGAVIGSAPKLSHEGLVAAAKAAEEKVAAEKRAMQLAAKKAAAATAKANRQKPKLIAPGGGIGLQAQPAAQSVTGSAVVGSAELVQASMPPKMQVSGNATASAADTASVQGKIHQGKWSRKKQ